MDHWSDPIVSHRHWHILTLLTIKIVNLIHTYIVVGTIFYTCVFVFSVLEAMRGPGMLFGLQVLKLVIRCSVRMQVQIASDFAKYFISKWNRQKTPLHLQHLGRWKRGYTLKMSLKSFYLFRGMGGSEKAPGNMELPLNHIAEKMYRSNQVWLI